MKKRKLAEEIRLINEIKKRPPLFKKQFQFKISFEEREHLWAEAGSAVFRFSRLVHSYLFVRNDIFKNHNNVTDHILFNEYCFFLDLSVNEAKRNWRNLRDQFKKAISSENPYPFRHRERMFFLEEHQSLRYVKLTRFICLSFTETLLLNESYICIIFVF